MPRMRPSAVPRSLNAGREGAAVIFVDVLIVVVLAIALLIGIRRGFAASLGTMLGLVAGGAAAFWATPLVAAWVPSLAWRGVAAVAAAVGLLLLGAALGGATGALVRSGVDRTPLRAVDRLFGGVVSVAVTALVVVVVAPSVTVTGIPGFSAAVASSRVLGFIDALTPPPMDAALAQLRSAVLDDGLPRFGELLGPGVGPTSPPVALDDPALAQAAASVARVSGVAYACGTGMSGSGFVVAPDRLVTNAHVVAGVDAPVVELPGQAAREGRVVYFDEVDDLAVIAVDRLGVRALPMASTLTAGAAAVVQGYPYGGPFTSIGASVLSVGTAPIPDIYGASAAARDIYALQAEVRPGNSGGPLLTGAGEVAGVVFARGEDDAQRGYAMTMTELEPVAAQASALTEPVVPGRCTG